MRDVRRACRGAPAALSLVFVGFLLGRLLYHGPEKQRPPALASGLGIDIHNTGDLSSGDPILRHSQKKLPRRRDVVPPIVDASGAAESSDGPASAVGGPDDSDMASEGDVLLSTTNADSEPLDAAAGILGADVAPETSPDDGMQPPPAAAVPQPPVIVALAPQLPEICLSDVGFNLRKDSDCYFATAAQTDDMLREDVHGPYGWGDSGLGDAVGVSPGESGHPLLVHTAALTGLPPATPLLIASFLATQCCDSVVSEPVLPYSGRAAVKWTEVFMPWRNARTLQR